MTPHMKLHKRPVALSFHRVGEAIAAKIVNYLCIDGKHNPTDTLSQNWSHNDILNTLNSIFF